MQQAQNATLTSSKPLSLSATAQIFGAILLGVVLIYGVGFVAVDIAHNAAHDTRHSFAFPCH